MENQNYQEDHQIEIDFDANKENEDDFQNAKID